MAHHHHHDQDSSYYLEQLWTIGTCGALGIVMVLLWHYQVLAIILDRKFHNPVLWGGIALLVLVALRIVDVWVTSRQLRAARATATDDVAGNHDHDHHDHHHDHDHDHAEHAAGECAHEGDTCCEHGHEHGWAPWRYAVLLLPTVLFLMKIPWPEPPEEPEKGDVMVVKLGELEQSAETPSGRDAWRNKTIRVKAKAQDLWGDPTKFGFVRLKMTCCYADAYGEPVKVIVQSPQPVNYAQLGSGGGWVKVIGKLDFIKTKNDIYVPVVKADTIKKISVPANQFDN